MWTSILLIVLGVGLLGLVGHAWWRRAALDRQRTALVESLLAVQTGPPVRRICARDRAGLPEPIRRYLDHVLPDRQPIIGTAHIQQHRKFRTPGSSAAWRPFTATQHVTTSPPGFVGDAFIEMIPWLPVHVLDACHEGRGILRASLGGILPLVDAPSAPELDEGELMRYLAETPVYPTALLPGMGVKWTKIDDSAARATLEYGGTAASLVFSVNGNDEVDRVAGRRAFMRDDGTYEDRPWVGTWRRYQLRSGMRIPVEGEVAWIGPEGEIPYWRGTMDGIDYTYTDTNAQGEKRRNQDEGVRVQ